MPTRTLKPTWMIQNINYYAHSQSDKSNLCQLHRHKGFKSCRGRSSMQQRCQHSSKRLLIQQRTNTTSKLRWSLIVMKQKFARSQKTYRNWPRWLVIQPNKYTNAVQFLTVQILTCHKLKPLLNKEIKTYRIREKHKRKYPVYGHLRTR